MSVSQSAIQMVRHSVKQLVIQSVMHSVNSSVGQSVTLSGQTQLRDGPLTFGGGGGRKFFQDKQFFSVLLSVQTIFFRLHLPANNFFCVYYHSFHECRASMSLTFKSITAPWLVLFPKKIENLTSNPETLKCELIVSNNIELHQRPFLP